MQPLMEATASVALPIVEQSPPPSWPLCNLSGWADCSHSIRIPENSTMYPFYFLLSFATGVEPGMQHIKKPWLIDK